MLFNDNLKDGIYLTSLNVLFHSLLAFIVEKLSVSLSFLLCPLTPASFSAATVCEDIFFLGTSSSFWNPGRQVLNSGR